MMQNTTRKITTKTDGMLGIVYAVGIADPLGFQESFQGTLSAIGRNPTVALPSRMEPAFSPQAEKG